MVTSLSQVYQKCCFNNSWLSPFISCIISFCHLVFLSDVLSSQWYCSGLCGMCPVWNWSLCSLLISCRGSVAIVIGRSGRWSDNAEQDVHEIIAYLWHLAVSCYPRRLQTKALGHSLFWDRAVSHNLAITLHVMKLHCSFVNLVLPGWMNKLISHISHW